MNLRILIYLNPSNIDKVTHHFNLNQDSGFVMVTNAIDELNKISKFHFYLLIPHYDFEWKAPKNVTLIKYPYINDALNSRYHFDSVFLNNIFNNYRHDIDLCWTMLPELVGNFKAFFSKRREEIPVFCYANWLQNSNASYEPSYKLRTIEGAMDCNAFGYQSDYMLQYMKDNLFKGFEIDYSKFYKITPKTNVIDISQNEINENIVFNHRISAESNFEKMFSLISSELKLNLWVTNINNGKRIEDKRIEYRSVESRKEYFHDLKKCRFGISYHVGYSMWSMSVLDLMSCGKVVLVPKCNSFIEMFGEQYKYFFENENEFIEKFNILQNCNEAELILWGAYNFERVKNNYTWAVLGKQLNDLFISLVTQKKTEKTISVLNVINQHGNISKQQIINKGLSDYGRICTRAWNKTRIELMRDFGVKDDINSSETVFFSCNSKVNETTLF